MCLRQAGCALLTLDVLVSDSPCALNDPEQLAISLGGALAAAPAGHFLRGAGAVTTSAGAAVRVADGSVVASASLSPSAGPTLLGADTCTLLCSDASSAPLSLTLYAVVASAALPTLRLSARQAGSFLEVELEAVDALGVAPRGGIDACLARLRMSVACDQLNEGLLLLELAAAGDGSLSAPLPLIVTSDTALARELACLGPARPLGRDGKDSTTAQLIADLGLVIDFVAAEGTVRDPAVALGASAFDR